MSCNARLFLAMVTALSIAAAAGEAQSKNLTSKDLLAPGTAVGRELEAPVNTRPVSAKWWWNDRWYDDGVLETPVNHEVSKRDVSYINPADDTEVPAILYRPKTHGAFPGVLFQHGRRGLDPLVQRLARRMAARGFVVLAPNVFDARFIDKFPLRHDPRTEGDVDAGVDFLLGQSDVSTSKICLYSHTRGGYYTLKVAVTFKRQKNHVACYVSFYPHLQDPNLTEPEQVYRYAPEIDKLEIPVLIFMGEYEQYQRRRPIELAVSEMKKAGRDARLVIYPGVGRGFDFRPPRVRTFADDLATKDSVARAAGFMRGQLAPWARTKPAKNLKKK